MSEELFNAIRAKNINRIRELIAEGASIDVQNKYGETALMNAAEYDRLEIVNVLIAAGADVNFQNRHGGTALMKASKNGYIDIVNALIEADANLNLQNRHGDTALMTAVEENVGDTEGNPYIEIINTLIAAGANVNLQNIRGDTALFRLTKKSIDVFDVNDFTLVEDYEERQNLIKYINEFIKDFEDILKILLENNANPYLENNKGETIFDIAKGNIQIINSIKKVIKDINKAKKRIAIDAYMRSRDKPYLPPNAENPLSGFFHKGENAADHIMKHVLNTIYGDDEDENEGAEESKRSDSGGRSRRKKLRRKSKSKRRKSVRRNSVRKRKSRSRKSGVRKKKSRSKRRKSVRK